MPTIESTINDWELRARLREQFVAYILSEEQGFRLEDDIDKSFTFSIETLKTAGITKAKDRKLILAKLKSVEERFQAAHIMKFNPLIKISDPDAIRLALESGSLVYDDNILFQEDFLRWSDRTQSQRANVTWRIAKILHDQEGDREIFYRNHVALVRCVSDRFVGLRGSRQTSGTEHQFLIDTDISGGLSQRPDVTWGGLSTVVMNSQNAYQQVSGFIEGKTFPLHNDNEKKFANIRKLYSYAVNVFNLRRERQPGQACKAIPVLSTDGVHMAVGIVQPGVRQDVLILSSHSRITQLQDQSDLAVVDTYSEGFDILLLFVYLTSVSNLRGDAEDLLQKFRDAAGLAFFNELGAVCLEVEDQVGVNTFFVRMGSERMVAKIGLSRAMLQDIGPADLSQAAVELEVFQEVPHCPGMQEMLHKGYFMNEDSCVLLFKVFGSLVPQRLDAENIDKLVSQAGSVLMHLQAYGRAHGDVARRNILAEVQASRMEYKLIDYGHSRAINEDFDSVYLSNDLFCGSDEAILGRPVTMLGDWQSLTYTMVALSGKATFPWSEAAAAGDRHLVVGIRKATSRDPQALLEGLPPKALAVGQLTCKMLDGQQAFSIDAFKQVLAV